MLTSIDKGLVSYQSHTAIYKFLVRLENGIENAYGCEPDKRRWVITTFDVSFDAQIASTGL